MAVHYVNPPAVCDNCRSPINSTFYDARTHGGAWGNLDQKCFDAIGVGLGTGRGQKYEKQPDGRFLKTAG